MTGNEGQQMKQMDNILGLDTSTAAMTVALLSQGSVLTSVRSDAERNHSIMLVPAIHEQLQQYGWSQEQVDGIAVGIGPGSYTGVRIAVTAAKTIAWAWNKPIKGVSSIEALAWSGLAAADEVEESLEGAYASDELARGQAGYYVYPLMDARRGQVYTARFKGEAVNTTVLTTDGLVNGLPLHMCERVEQDQLRLFSELVTELEQELEKQAGLIVYLVGELGPQREQADAFAARYGARVRIVPCEMDAAWIARLGHAALSKGEADEVHRLEPNYTQLTEAEVKQNAKEQAEAKQRE